MRVIGVIPARGGSKGVHRKNIRLLNGKPLIYYTIREALKSKLIDELVVSTEDKEIRRVAESYGVKVINRPIELATDNTLIIDVLKSIIKNYETKNTHFDIIVLLEPTHPFRSVEDIDSVIQIMKDNGLIDSVRSVTEPFQSPYKMWLKKDNGLLKSFLGKEGDRRQDLPEVFWQNGSIYAFKTSIIKKGSLTGKNIYPYIMKQKDFIDIDTKEDLLLAQKVMGWKK